MDKNSTNVDMTPENIFTPIQEPTPHHTPSFHKKFLTTPVAIIIASLILGLSHIGYGILVGKTPSGPISFFAGAPITKEDFVTGEVDSDVIVVEYSDTECPFCARLHPVMAKIQDEYKDTVAFVYRYFPLTQIHPGAFAEAQAIECVGKELGGEKRREYINKLFEYKIANNAMTLPKNGKEDLAKNIGVNQNTFLKCLSEEASSVKVAQSIEDGIQAGVSGTPATFILKRDGDKYNVVALIEGAREYEYFKAVIEAALR